MCVCVCASEWVRVQLCAQMEYDIYWVNRFGEERGGKMHLLHEFEST